MKTTIATAAVLLAFVLIILAAFLINKNTPRPALSDVRFSPPTSPSDDVKSTATNKSIREEYLAGVGIIEPAGEAIAIGSALQGIVHAVLVNPGDVVETGQALLLLDDRTAKANVGIASADLAAQEAKLAEVLAQIDTQKARVDAALAQNSQVAATLANAQLKVTRSEKLLANKSISFEDFDLSKLNFSVAEARVAEAAAKYREAVAGLKLLESESGAPSIEVQKAAVAQARAILIREQVTLDQHTIRPQVVGQFCKSRFVPASLFPRRY